MRPKIPAQGQIRFQVPKVLLVEVKVRKIIITIVGTRVTIIKCKVPPIQKCKSNVMMAECSPSEWTILAILIVVIVVLVITIV